MERVAIADLLGSAAWRRAIITQRKALRMSWVAVYIDILYASSNELIFVPVGIPRNDGPRLEAVWYILLQTGFEAVLLPSVHYQVTVSPQSGRRNLTTLYTG